MERQRNIRCSSLTPRDSVADAVSGFIAEGVEAGDVVLAVMQARNLGVHRSPAPRARGRPDSRTGLRRLDCARCRRDAGNLPGQRQDRSGTVRGLGRHAGVGARVRRPTSAYLRGDGRRACVSGRLQDRAAARGALERIAGGDPIQLFYGYSSENFRQPQALRALQRPAWRIHRSARILAILSQRSCWSRRLPDRARRSHRTQSSAAGGQISALRSGAGAET